MGLVFTRAGRKHAPKEVAFHHYHAALMGLRVDAYQGTTKQRFVGIAGTWFRVSAD